MIGRLSDAIMPRSCRIPLRQNGSEKRQAESRSILSGAEMSQPKETPAPQQQQGQQAPSQQQSAGQPQPIFKDWAAF